MKATELMIGDWVMYNPNVFIEDEYAPMEDSYPTKIKSGEDIDLVIEDCYAPIPLTEEILKNEFESKDNIFGYKTYILNKDYSIECRGDRFCFMRRCNDYTYSSTFWICDLMFFHELQHAIKLCKINKEIHP